MPAKVSVPYDVLYNLYVIQGKSHKEMAKILTHAPSTILKLLRYNGIKCRKKVVDLTGRTFEKWTVLSRAANDSKCHAVWLCECECGNTALIKGYTLTSSRSTRCKKCANNEFVNLTGQKIGRWTVIKPVVKHIGICWECRCECGTVRVIRGCELRKGRKACNHCAGYTGYGDISGCYWSGVIKGAKYRSIVFDIVIKEAWEVFLKQSGKCALTGEPLCFVRNYSKDCKEQTASLDRIDSGIGYVKNNIQWVHKKINSIKLNCSQNEFINWCKKVAEHHK
jgi:hypothetical protein